jgi:hypothetical protein
MNTIDRLKILENRLKSTNHNDLFLQTKHIVDGLNAYVETHNLILNAQIIGGSKLNRDEENVFHSTISDFKDQLLTNLETTADDLEHKGDKNYMKNFSDGVE